MSKYLKHHLKLGKRLLQTCEFSRKLGVSLLYEYIHLQMDVPDSDRETKIKHRIHRLLRQNHNIIIFEDKHWNEKGICLKMLQNVGIGGIALSGDVQFNLIFSSRSVNKYARPDFRLTDQQQSYRQSITVFSISPQKCPYAWERPTWASCCSFSISFFGRHVYWPIMFPPISCPTLTMFRIQNKAVHIVKYIHE